LPSPQLRAAPLANKVARIVYALMTSAANTATGRSRPDGLEGLGKKNSRRKARLEIEGADEVM
jgi:hypothetical protein